uniref:ABC-type branched-chain amino acid transport system, permease component n=1 Tax=Candidatus Kentrum sp. LFY TaxID=2126342 RepID=A0A450WDG5_9GAMM|nr:MAG: ABC-type branched-chain amino acid transport system, permease component [Candidatus Kentron sp. LFY]
MEIKRSTVGGSVVFLAIIIIVFAVLDPFRRDVIIAAACFALCAASFDYASGFAGLRSLGPIIPFGIGAYLNGYLIREGAQLTLSLPIVFIVTALIGFLLYRTLIGSREDTSTWVVFGLIASLMLEQFARLSINILGGSNGLIIPRYFGNGANSEHDIFLFYGIVLGVLVIGIGYLGYAVYSRRGALLLLLQHDPDRLKAIGYYPHRKRAIVILQQWGISSIAGAIYVSTVGAVDPSIFGLDNNLTILIAAVAFGEKSIMRPALAAFCILFFENIAGSIFVGYQTLILGIVFILTLYFYDGNKLRGDVPRLSLGTFGIRL